MASPRPNLCCFFCAGLHRHHDLDDKGENQNPPEVLKAISVMQVLGNQADKFFVGDFQGAAQVL